jgi:hypothetical protein
MGIRQTSQPLGIALGAAVIPPLAKHGLGPALMFTAIACTAAAVACALGVADPPRRSWSQASDAELANPYRGSTVLWRIHLFSAFLTVPQCVTTTFMLVWLIVDTHWSIASAGALVTATQLIGAMNRIAAGRWSDRVRVRLRPIRTIATASALAMLVLAITDYLHSPIAAWVMALAAIFAVTDNGLEANAITEFAGPFWSGRALGTQNTSQRLVTAVGAPAFGALIAATGYPLAFAVCGLFSMAAVPVAPVNAEPKGRPVLEALRTLHIPPGPPPTLERPGNGPD